MSDYHWCLLARGGKDGGGGSLPREKLRQPTTYGGAIGYARIEDYALIGDTHSAALVSSGGSIDWLCLPRFDSPACFAALLDDLKGGRWKIAPAVEFRSSRRYRPDTMILETRLETSSGAVRLIDLLPVERSSDPNDPRGIVTEDLVVRVVEGLDGSVPMTMEMSPRFDYGTVVPWIRETHRAIEAVGGPHALDLYTAEALEIADASVRSEFEISAGRVATFVAHYHPSHLPPYEELADLDPRSLVSLTEDFWQKWVGRCDHESRWRPEVVRSLLTLKCLTYSPTGGLVAAPTTSLPESIGGQRNWDYRYCWLRDATFTLDVLLEHGYTAEATEWRDWLLRAVAGEPSDLQIMYGVMGERRLMEAELDWLEGYERSSPVRVGNKASEQFQLDVYGEVLDSFHTGRRAGIETTSEGWVLEKDIVEFVCEHWREPDEGIWEVRSGSQHFVHSKVMAWVAVDRAIRAVERFGVDGPIDHWREVREEIEKEVCTRGVDSSRGRFIRAYDDPELDASLLMLPLVGFIDANDPLMRNTIEAIESELMREGFLVRYRAEVDDGLPPGEGVFLLCTFWLVDCLVLLGRRDDAVALFDRLVGLCNDVGLLSEEYDPKDERFLGNFPQAFSHVALITSAMALIESERGTPMRRGT